MFEDLEAKLANALKKIKGQALITEQDALEVLKNIKFALLEADVNYKVVKDIEQELKDKLIGKQIEKNLTPFQTIVDIIHKELTQILGDESSNLIINSKPFVVMLVGIQGSGKTTTCAKLARLLKSKGRQVLLVACDIYRPAAVKQLQTLGKQLDIPVFSKENTKPQDIALESLQYAKANGRDIVIVDTAGRLQVDTQLMQELVEMKEAIKPNEVLLVVDSMIGQEAVNIAKKFDENVGISGLIFTKMDADARGGALLSIKRIVGKPIKFIGVGEKISDLEQFYPDRIASRILGMGDILTLIEQAKNQIDEKEQKQLQKKLKKNQFTLDDFLNQLKKIQKMGSITSIIKMIPGLNKIKMADTNEFDIELKRITAIIQSMTKKEKENYKIIDASRKRRIAKGSGTDVQSVNKLLKQFEEMNKMMKGLDKNKALHIMKNLGRM
ncbi:signal recognition particle subunit FFH/SRP54 (srp54) [Desulfurella multipotens]|uniref:Signal recognition particle protein n=1 Tax=Desulfurella multipotens TaxID=79269 RepID=A0A1G6N0F7_9BACT|nr:signal recognition particle protein [Desulfurella multipotens]SDC61310.1 signal recognition particle subunit FFH/SRP54 (srp54) [Desulfurella multipotens]